MSRAQTVILIVAGISLIAVMIHLAGTGEIIYVLYHADPLIGMAAVCEVVALLLWSLRWKVLLTPFQSGSFANVAKGVLIGIFFSNITPMARTGGEPFRAYYLGKKENIPVEDVFATIVVDRVMDSIPFMVIISVSMAYLALRMELSTQMIVILMVIFFLNVGFLSLVLYFSLNVRAAKILVHSILKFFSKFLKRAVTYQDRMEAAVEEYHDAIKKYSAQKKNLALSIVISFVFWGFLLLRNYYVIEALQYHMPLTGIAVVQTAGPLVGIIPLLPGGVGSVDGTMVFLYMSFHFSATAAVGVCLVDRFISFWVPTVIGGLCVFLERDFLK